MSRTSRPNLKSPATNNAPLIKASQWLWGTSSGLEAPAKRNAFNTFEDRIRPDFGLFFRIALQESQLLFRNVRIGGRGVDRVNQVRIW